MVPIPGDTGYTMALGKVVGIVQLTHRTAMYRLWHFKIAKA